MPISNTYFTLPSTTTEPNTNPPLYSDRAVRVFSVVFSAIAGGALLAQNLRDVGRPDAARKALWGSIAYTVLILIAAFFLPDRASGGAGINVAVGLAGGYGLTAYADKVMGDRSAFPAKKIWKPLLICLLIFVPFIALLIYAADSQ